MAYRELISDIEQEIAKLSARVDASRHGYRQLGRGERPAEGVCLSINEEKTIRDQVKGMLDALSIVERHAKAAKAR